MMKTMGMIRKMKISSWASGLSKMYFGHLKPPGVPERMWSVNFNVSISGEYQTLGGHSNQPWEQLGSLMMGTGLPWQRL